VTALNGLTEQVQYFQVGTSGTDFNIASATATHTFNLPTASAVNRGALSSADWAIFNGKQNAITLTTTGTSGVSTLVGSTLNIPNYSTDLSGYVTLDTTQTITGFKTILRGGDVLNFKIGTDTLYGLKVAYNQNELVPSGEATWSFVNTFNRNGTGYETTPISFFRGVLVTGQRLLSASVNTNLLDYYSNNPSGRYPIYAYNTGVQQFASSIIVGETTGVVDAITGAIADLPAGVVANFKGRVIGSNAVNNNEFATLGQVTSTSRAAISLTTTGTSGPATYNNTTGVLNIPEYQGGVTSFNTRTGAVTLTSSDVTTALGYTPVTDARTLTINGVTYDLTANRTWTVGVNPSAREIETFIATSGQTTFTVTGGYTVGLVDVFINGVRLTSSDYTATNGTTVVLTVGTMVGNIVDIIKYTSGLVNSISGTGTTNELAYFTDSTVIASLSTATYPSLTELSYVKGVTSSIQTQLNGKQNTLTNPVTGTGMTNTLPKFTGSTTIGNSLFTDDGTNGAFGGANYSVGTSVRTFNISAPLYAGIGFWANNVYTGDIFSYTVSGNLIIAADPTNILTDSRVILATDGTQRLAVFSDGNVTIANSPTNAGFKLDVNGTGRFTGNLGVGITSFASWASGTENAFQVKNSSIYEYGGYETALSVNAYFNAGWKYIGTNTATQLQLSAGTLNFKSAVSGTAGNAITWTTPLSIAPSGTATFSSSVFAGGSVLSSPSGADTIIGAYGGQDCSLILQDAVQLWELYVNDDFYINRGSTNVLSLNRTTGAATFSSTVRINADGQSLLIFPTTTNSVRMQIQSTGGGNLVLGTENSTGGNLATGTNAYASVFTSGSTKDLVLGTNSVARLTINGSSGNVGIDTNTPNGKLTIRAAASDIPSLVFKNEIGGPSSAISNYVSAAQTFTMFGTNVFVNSTANLSRFDTSKESSAILFDEGLFRVLTGQTGSNPSTRMSITSSGAASFTDSVTAQGFNTSIGTVSVPTSTWVTVYTIPSTQAAEGVYYAYGHYNDDSGGMAFIQVLADRTHLRAINGSNSSVQMQISGRNIQVLQVYGVTLSIQYSILWQKLR